MFDAGRVVGWAGGQPHYDGNAWELHPMVVAPAHQGRGIGTALMRDLETLVARRGALTLWLGSDDEQHETSLGGADLYADFPGAIRGIRNLRRHPYEFYQRLGFTIVGVMPDANGRSRPDIILAKRIAPIDVRREPLDAPMSLALIGRLNAELSAAYPEEGANHFQLDLDEVSPGRGGSSSSTATGSPAAMAPSAVSTPKRRRSNACSSRRTCAAEDSAARYSKRWRRKRARLAPRDSCSKPAPANRRRWRSTRPPGSRTIPLYGEYFSSPETSLCLGKELA